MECNLREATFVALQLNKAKGIHKKLAQQSKTGICYLIFDDKLDFSRASWLKISEAIEPI